MELLGSTTEDLDKEYKIKDTTRNSSAKKRISHEKTIEGFLKSPLEDSPCDSEKTEFWKI